MSATVNFRFIQPPERLGFAFVEHVDVPSNTYLYHKSYAGELQEDGTVYITREESVDKMGDAIPRALLEQMDQYVVTTNGYWARGDTPAAAAKGILKQTSRRMEVAILDLIINDPKPHVDGNGYLCYAYSATRYRIGKFKRLSAIASLT